MDVVNAEIEAMGKEEFRRRFTAEMLRLAGEKFDDGSSIAAYASEVGPTYWGESHQREDGPEECAAADISYWGD